GEGDTVGCGVLSVPRACGGGAEAGAEGAAGRRLGDWKQVSRKVFFTINGQLVGMPFTIDDVPADVPLWPCVGLDAPWVLSFNFGQRPFHFDLDAIAGPVWLSLDTPFETAEDWALGDLSAAPPPPGMPRRRRRPADPDDGDPRDGPPPWPLTDSSGSEASSEAHSEAHPPAVDSWEALASAAPPSARGSSAPPAAASGEDAPAAAGEPAGGPARRRAAMPLVSKATERPLLGRWASGPALAAAARRRGVHRWLQPRAGAALAGRLPRHRGLAGLEGGLLFGG
ncbi:unnamed protein product, partial [Prorocentrum cordatum]